MLRGILNLGILAHVDAGKTSLTERLLYSAGVIGEPGSVDAGTTQTDSLALERQRGITIKSAVVSFTVGGSTVNLIDTPGHPDFVAEVERALSVLDGAVLVISAVEGIQPQTRILWRALQRLRVPTLLFVNKIDRRGAGCERVLGDIADRLTPAVIAMDSVRGLGTRDASVIAANQADPAARSRLAELLAERDDGVLRAYLDDKQPMPPGWLRERLARQVKDALVHPVYFGSAITGAGVEILLHELTGLLPAAGQDAAGPVSGRVFKIERGPAGDRIACARLFSGTIATRDRVRFSRGRDGKVTAISVFADGTAGTAFRFEVGHQSVPLYIYKNMESFAAAMQEYLSETLRQGLYGWQVTDCTVALIRSGYSVPDGPPSTRGPLSGPQDFRKLTPLVMMAALKRAGTVVCEPVHHFRLETPGDTLSTLLPLLARLQAVASVSATKDSWCTVEGDIPVAWVHELRQQIPHLTRGEGVMESAFDHYGPVRGQAPTRPRTDDNPLHREEYLRRVTRRGARDIGDRTAGE